RVAERHLGKITCLSKQPSGRSSPATHLTVNLPLEQVVALDAYTAAQINSAAPWFPKLHRSINRVKRVVNIRWMRLVDVIA
ncbi:hypothetical protein, partial [Sapientia aquatica]|uniref:hypothetical protein n=1 Tax=Sapientia aquatica TaxID=1549640 RepID=UPI00197EE22A